MFRLILFFIGTIFFFKFSERALKNTAAHGFYRFFIFEGIWALALLNEPYWFLDPFTKKQVLSWIMLALSLYLVIASFNELKKYGGQLDRLTMPENHAFENTISIVESGLYRYIRHPMYSSLLFLGWGSFLKRVTFLNVVLILIVSVMVIVVAKVEENENINYFGEEYQKYMMRTTMFVPFLF